MELQVMLYTVGTMAIIYLLVRNAYKRGVVDALHWAQNNMNKLNNEDKTND